MPGSTSKLLVFHTFFVCLLAFSFWLFFDFSKHHPSLAQVNPFAEDPYDAVGSFGVQLTVFCALVSILRLAHPHSEGIKDYQASQVIRSNSLALVSLIVTLVADILALLANPSLWLDDPAGWILTSLVVLLLFAAIVVLGWALRMIKSLNPGTVRRPWGRMVSVCLVGSLLLVLYPPAWRESPVGAIGAAVLGMTVLMVAAWSLALVIFPIDMEVSADILDDLESLYNWLTDKTHFAASFYRLIERFFKARWLRAIVEGLNPRRHPWNLVVLAALGMGMTLLIAEAVGEGAPDQSHLFLVIGVVLGIEGMGILLSYGLFSGFLGLFRRE